MNGDDLAEDVTIDEARLRMVRQLHVALFGDTWARPESPKDVWSMLLAKVVELRRCPTCGGRGDYIVPNGDRETLTMWPCADCNRTGKRDSNESRTVDIIAELRAEADWQGERATLQRLLLKAADRLGLAPYDVKFVPR